MIKRVIWPDADPNFEITQKKLLILITNIYEHQKTPKKLKKFILVKKGPPPYLGTVNQVKVSQKVPF